MIDNMMQGKMKDQTVQDVKGQRRGEMQKDDTEEGKRGG